MPAIDPRKLDEQIQRAVAHVGNPEELVRSLEEVFAFYADRTRKGSVVLEASDTIPRFGAPKPVVRKARRTLIRLIRDADRLDPEPLIQALWDGGERELRLIAVTLLAELDWEEAVEWAEKLLESNRDLQVVEALVESGLSGWQRVPDDELMTLFQKWLRSENSQLQRLSLLLLLQHIEAASSAWLPRYFNLMAGAADGIDRQAQPILRQALRRLAAWNPAETAQFLLDEGRGNNWRPEYRQLVEEVIDSFPQAQQRELRSTLMLQ